MSEIHYMIDIEALGTSHDCVIVSVGIVKFKLKTGEILDKKYWELCLGEQQRAGRTIDSSTLMWWAKQSPEVLKALQSTDRIGILDFIREFNYFIREPGYYHAKGTNYDLEIIGNLYRLFKERPPFKYSKWLDARVYYFTGKALGILPKLANTRAHNALSDAEYQTEVVCAVFKAMQSNIGRKR